MDLSRLAAFQKRLRDWEEYLSSPLNVHSTVLRQDILNSLQEYKSVLASCWENSSVTPADEAKLKDIERDLDRMHEDARLTVIPRKELRAN